MSAILFDLVSAQVDRTVPYNGGSEYIKSLFQAIIQPGRLDSIHVLLSRNLHLDPQFENKVRLFLPPERIHWLEEIMETPAFWATYRIDRLFLGIFQRYCEFSSFLESIPPSVAITVTIHDIVEHITDWSTENLLFVNTSPLRHFLLTAVRGKFRQNRVRAQTRALFELLNARGNTQWLADTKYTKATILHHLGGQANAIEVLWPPPSPNQTMAAALEPKLVPPGAPYLMLGANRWSKNLPCVLRAGTILVSSGYDFRLKLVGNFQGMPIARHIRSLPWVEIANYGTPESLIELITSSRGLLFPTWCEGFGYPPLEALLVGRPVIASSSTCVPEVLGEVGLYHAPSNPLQLAHQIVNLERNCDPMTSSANLREAGLSRLSKQKEDLDKLCHLIFRADSGNVLEKLNS